jgi:predicted transglutaminase-like cysteine proteinase
MSKYRILAFVAIATGITSSLQSTIASEVLDAENTSTIEQISDAHDASLADALDLAPAAPRNANIPPRFFTINQVLARQGRQSASPTVVRLASIQPSVPVVNAPTTAQANASATARGQEPFGLFTFRAPEGQLWVKWREVSATIRVELRAISACQEDEESCSQPARRFASLVDAASRMSGRKRYDLVNRVINTAVRYTSDLNNHGLADKWSAPLATLSSGRGDCEDYAIAKYVALLEAGTPKSDLRLVLVHDRSSRQHHAILAARHEGHWLILDNRWSELRPDSDVAFTPLFTVSAEGVRLFVAPYSMRKPSRDQITPASD